MLCPSLILSLAQFVLRFLSLSLSFSLSLSLSLFLSLSPHSVLSFSRCLHFSVSLALVLYLFLFLIISFLSLHYSTSLSLPLSLSFSALLTCPLSFLLAPSKSVEIGTNDTYCKWVPYSAVHTSPLTQEISLTLVLMISAPCSTDSDRVAHRSE